MTTAHVCNNAHQFFCSWPRASHVAKKISCYKKTENTCRVRPTFRFAYTQENTTTTCNLNASTAAQHMCYMLDRCSTMFGEQNTQLAALLSLYVKLSVLPRRLVWECAGACKIYAWLTHEGKRTTAHARVYQASGWHGTCCRCRCGGCRGMVLCLLCVCVDGCSVRKFRFGGYNLQHYGLNSFKRHTINVKPKIV